MYAMYRLDIGWRAGEVAPAVMMVGNTELNGEELKQLYLLLQNGQEHAFYCWGKWRKLAEYVRKMDRNECQICRANGRYRKGRIVHHVKHLRDRPDLALSIFDPEDRTRQLITVCKHCHEKAHPEIRKAISAVMPITEERWD